MNLIDKTKRFWQKQILVKDRLIKLTPPKDDIDCISSNVYFLNLPNLGWISIDLGGQKYSESLLEESPQPFEHSLLTHSHADHIGDLNLFQNKKIYLSKKEIKQFYNNSKEAIFTGFSWTWKKLKELYANIKKLKCKDNYLRVGSQADKIAENANQYKFYSVEDDLVRALNAKQLTALDDLLSLETDRLAFLTFPGHSTEGIVYLVKFKEGEKPYVFLGDAFAPFTGPTGNQQAQKPFTLNQLFRLIKDKRKLCLGHDQDYFKNKELPY